MVSRNDIEIGTIEAISPTEKRIDYALYNIYF